MQILWIKRDIRLSQNYALVRACEGCSRLSPYLAWGVISHAELAKRVNQALTVGCETQIGQCEALQRAARFYLDRLAWRMGYHAYC